MSDWQPPTELPDLRRADAIAIDTETRDNRLVAKMGSGWPFADGHICGVSVAYRAGSDIRGHYFPLRHPDTENINSAKLFQWLDDLIRSGVRVVAHNGLYDFGWLGTEANIRMPAADRLEEIGALATLVDENRYSYRLDALCAWRNLPGKDIALLRDAATAIGMPKRGKPQAYIWQLPARFVGPYAEADAANTLALWESLDPVLDQEGTRAAYRLEVELLPMVQAMRRRGIRIDVAAAERARDHLLQKRDAAFAELSEKLGATVGMAEIGRNKWLSATFDQHGIKYPRTPKGNPSFTAGTTGWMQKHEHWLPQLIVKADKFNNAAVNFLQGHILDHVVNGRIHAEIHPHRSDEGGTRSLRFSYSNPPLQLAAMINRPESEARAIFKQYDSALPFINQLSRRCQNEAADRGYLTLYDGARRHWSDWEAPGVAWTKGAGPCARDEAERRIKDSAHPWYGRTWLRRADTYKALNALIQGSAARHTKLWMRACWREGIVPLLQMHDALDCSVGSPEQADRVARLGCEAVGLEVPIQVDLKFGRNWGDAKHSWEELHSTSAIVVPPPQAAAAAD